MKRKILTPPINGNLATAFECYLDRQAKKVQPKGKLDEKGIWRPTRKERKKCCKAIKPGSIIFPYVELVHCRSAVHIAQLHQVNLQSLRSCIARWHADRKRRNPNQLQLFEL